LEEQKELSVDTLKYLGKMNVQLSIIKQLVKKFKTPAKKKRLEGMMNEMLQSIAGLIGNKKISLRIVDLNNCKTMHELHLTRENNIKENVKKISNEMLCEKLQRNNIDDVRVVSSEHDNFSLKTFVFVENPESKANYKIDDEQFELVQDMVNQCEVIYLLCKSDYHK